jgi:UDP-glucose 4-epimerase
MKSFAVTGVMHLAARKSVPESLVDPMTYFRENVDGTLSVVRAMLDAGVDNIVLASSAAVYGEIADGVVTEAHPTVPVSPYGESKLVSEWIIRAVARSHGLAAMALRYFNVAGAADPRLADTGAVGLVPAMVDAARSGRRPVVFGTSYPTPDGSCVRDYVHVCDLAEAHVRAARHIGESPGDLTVLNLGSGRGTSVLEVAAAVCDHADPAMSAVYGEPRAGDVPAAVASVEAIRARLGWVPVLGLDAMVAAQWDAWRAAPRPPEAVADGCDPDSTLAGAARQGSAGRVSPSDLAAAPS